MKQKYVVVFATWHVFSDPVKFTVRMCVPLSTESRATPHPVAPPPITSTSNTRPLLRTSICFGLGVREGVREGRREGGKEGGKEGGGEGGKEEGREGRREGGRE